MKNLSFALLIALCLGLATCSSQNSGDTANSERSDSQESSGAAEFTKQVDVFGIHIYATEKTADEKVLHAANITAEYLDNDEDGVVDNPKLLEALVSRNTTIIMALDEDELSSIPRNSRPRGQPLFDRETHPNGPAEGRFDYSIEEILHPITGRGYADAYPDVFGTTNGTELSKAMDLARGGYFEEVPEQYPEGAWYTYYDETCSYGCMMTEYMYWSLSSILGAQDLPGRLDQIGDEWPLNTREKVAAQDPSIYALLTDPQYHFPTVLPDGTYKVATFTIEEYP